MHNMRPPPHPPDKDEGTAAARPDSGPEKSVMGGTTTLVSTPPSITHGSGLATAMSNSMHDDLPPANSTPLPFSEDACLYFADRSIFHVERTMNVNEKRPPLAQETRRYGNVVPLPSMSATGSGTGYRIHVPLTVHVRVNGTDSRTLSSLLDTGASLSVIDAGLLSRLGGRPQGTSMAVHGLGDTRTLGWTTLTAFIDGTDLHGTHVALEFRHDFHVLPRFAPGLCLGQDFIAGHDVSISPARGRARVGPFTFAVSERVDGPPIADLTLVVAEDIVLEPGFQAWVPVGASSLAPGVDYAVLPRLTVSPDESVRLTGPSGVMVHQPRAFVLLGNYGSSAHLLGKGTVIADAVAARVGDVVRASVEVFRLTAASHVKEYPLAATEASASDDLASAPGVPLDVFAGTEDVDNTLIQDAATSVFDDAFRIGVDPSGTAPPEVLPLLRRHHAAFALDGRPGRVVGFDMAIPLRPDANLRPEAPRRASPEKRHAMDAAIDQLLDWDVIEPSHSSVSFPVIMVKQQAKWRFCVDYRQLNTHTIPDRYPLPTIDSVFQTLSGKKWFSALDAIRGYHQLGSRLVSVEGKTAVASRVSIPWADEQQRSFDALKAAISQPPVLAHPNPAHPYILYVDASKEAFAAILHQVCIEDDTHETLSESSSAATLAHLAVPLLPPSVARARWTQWLRDDRVFGLMLRDLEKSPDSRPGWVLRDGVLIRCADDKLALPEAGLPTILRAAHDGTGHFGFVKTFLAISRRFWRPSLSTAVRAWVKHCGVCQRTKSVPKTGSLDIDNDASGPFERISIDLVLGLPLSRSGNDAALAILDTFSRMVLLTPCHHTVTADGIAAIVSDRVLRMRWRPQRIVSDSEARMTGARMAALAASLGATLTPSTPYHQQANAVERSIQTVQKVLQALSVDSAAHWDKRALPAAELAISSSPAVSTGVRPFDLVFVSHPSIVHAVFDDAEHLGVASFPERLAAAHERLEDARAAMVSARREQKRRYDARQAPLPPIQAGDRVFVRLADRPIPGAVGSKLDARKSGPFVVDEVLSPHRVRLLLPEGVAVDPVMSVEQLDLVPPSPDPFALARAGSPPPVRVVEDAPDPPSACTSPSLDPVSRRDVVDGLNSERVSSSVRGRRPPPGLRDFDLGTLAAHTIVETL
ncbi:hypothetical protein CF336_g5033 [Tilletia laevis]|nr:hypothetical protein CF336_g5033 [Tilletia laevis]